MSGAGTAVRYPLHNPGGPGHVLQPGDVCSQPLVPPEVTGSRVWGTTDRLVCPEHGLVAATPEQIEQARNAAKADGTWPEVPR